MHTRLLENDKGDTERSGETTHSSTDCGASLLLRDSPCVTTYSTNAPTQVIGAKASAPIPLHWRERLVCQPEST